jgi:hypothetical protein
MPHGDFSDITAITMIVGGIQQMMYPEFQLTEIAPLKAFFDTPALTPELEIMIRFSGGFLLILGCMLFTVRWNTINGKLSGLACIGCGVNIARSVFLILDAGVFVMRPFYIYGVVLVICGIHLMFNANPIVKVDTKSS